MGITQENGRRGDSLGNHTREGEKGWLATRRLRRPPQDRPSAARVSVSVGAKTPRVDHFPARLIEPLPGAVVTGVQRQNAPVVVKGDTPGPFLLCRPGLFPYRAGHGFGRRVKRATPWAVERVPRQSHGVPPSGAPATRPSRPGMLSCPLTSGPGRPSHAECLGERLEVTASVRVEARAPHRRNNPSREQMPRLRVAASLMAWRVHGNWARRSAQPWSLGFFDTLDRTHAFGPGSRHAARLRAMARLMQYSAARLYRVKYHDVDDRPVPNLARLGLTFGGMMIARRRRHYHAG